MKPILIATAVLLVLFLLVWLGLRIQPAAFAPYRQASAQKSMPLPAGLPAPVERFYRATYGETLPVIKTAVLSGRGTMSPFGLAMPFRFRFLYDEKMNYRATIDATFYTLPVMKVSETYIDGHALGKMPYGTDEGKWFDESMNARVYCELLTWLPAALLTPGTGARWEPFDENTAVLVIPLDGKEERVIVRFDEQTGKVVFFEAYKYRKANEKMLWINATWFDQGRPWIHLTVEETLYNVDVEEAIRGEAGVEASAAPAP